MKTAEYKDHRLTVMIVPAEGGGFHASIAIVEPAGGARSQRFLDLGVFEDPEEATKTAFASAEAWVDDEARSERRQRGTDFASLF
ncbi:hypothetical protein [Piscinibacter koreensis]|uniref:Uncharacterized protein n=1 Tax=Piscinibacter koreensis TaxID=2742824 RepID=A0A7Y6NTH3_9BURK|nr:hypothetical protein [Schlegelella koreensis]NUZ08999.1 hypothetical protein [Schlegelella koreensis]